MSHNIYSCQISKTFAFSRQIFAKILKYKILRYPTIWSRGVSYGQTVGGADIIVAFRNFANAPNKTKKSYSLS